MTEQERAYYAERMREYRRRHADDPEYRERKREADRKYQAEHKAEISIQRKAKYALNPEPAKQRAQKRAAEHPEKVKAYRDANREIRNAQTRAWKKANRERYLQKMAEYHEKRKDEQKVYRLDRYNANAEAMREKSRQWRKANPEKLAKTQKRYRAENVIKILDKNAKRRAVLKGATVEKVDRGAIYLRDNGICGICKAHIPLHEVTLDHIIPLAKGGEHSIRNIQLAHRSCNSSKGAKVINQ